MGRNRGREGNREKEKCRKIKWETGIQRKEKGGMRKGKERSDKDKGTKERKERK